KRVSLKMSAKVSSVNQISSNVTFGRASGSIMEVVKKESEPDAVSPEHTSNKPYAIWGRDNNFPQRHIDEVKKDVVSIGAIEFKIAAHYGLGPFLYRRRVDKDKGRIHIEPVLLEELDPEIQDFWEMNDIENFSQENITNFEWFRHY